MNRDATERAITEWLARTHPDPAQAHTEWVEHGIALLPLGRRFAVVRVPERLIHAALGTSHLDEITRLLTDRLKGPVIRDSRSMGTPYYALIEWHAGLVWDTDEEAPCLGDGTHMGVPRLDVVAPPGAYWLVPPRDAGDLCRPQAVRDLIEDARSVLVAAADLAEVKA